MHNSVVNLLSLVRCQTLQRNDHVPSSTEHSPDANTGHEHSHSDFCHRIIHMIIACASVKNVFS